MADESLKAPVVVRAIGLNASSLPRGMNPAYEQYVLSQAVDFTAVAGKANDAGGGAYDAQVRNDEQDEILVDHEIRLDAAEATIADHETRITSAEAAIVSLDSRVTVAENDIEFLTEEVIDLQTTIANHEGRITTLETNFSAYQTYMNRQKSEVVYSGISLNIPITASNLLTLLAPLTPTSGTLLPFFVLASGRLKALNKFKNLDFKINIRGTYVSSSGNRSMQMTFGTVVPDTLVVTRDAATTVDDIFINTFFAVDEGDDIVSPGIAMTIKANGSAFTATQIKIIATQ